MRNDEWIKRRAGVLLLAYAFFCAGAVSAIFWAENILLKNSHPESFGILSTFSTLRWGILFLTGLPFMAYFYKRQIEQERLAHVDDITGLYNHRQLLEALEHELSRAKRYTQELSVMMIDIDNFKNVNDRYGHLAGDELLQAVGSILSGDKREVDIAGRYGGDEFLMILPHTGYEEAQRLAWRLWMNIHRHLFKIHGKLVRVSISLGISSLRDLGKETDRFCLIHRADQAMLSAKNAKHHARDKAVAA